MKDAREVGAVIGNPRSGSRTTQVAREVVRQLADTLGAVAVEPVELANHGPALLDPEAAAVDADRDALAELDVLVVASPTYKASYTGMLKCFLDRYGTDGLAEVVAVPVMVGGAPHHALAVEVHLRPLLVELGASVPSRGLYVLDSQLDQLSDQVASWLREGPWAT
ncbi:NAD(P)H-dependent oxidoreductase [Nocardioides sp. AE5]|uniref:NADPH-dependent FMN reductase n=1 Tax=Nocardioides sp. AE5 TaxID=2962573 RepID=UPI0028818010|nr:NAD(P)H-dependent oxidoreductase [Nocardioides sp. AE5]MDT0203060.1 NAD(P)H-dependent oxidoreductase [Nocardioides sp. AE5]